MLVELVNTLVTSESALARTEQFASAALGKQVVRCSDRSGFVVNALLVPYLLPAVRMAEAGAATIKDSDTAVVAGLSHPMCPLRLSDLIGLDTPEIDSGEDVRGVQGAVVRPATAVAAHGRGWDAR